MKVHFLRTMKKLLLVAFSILSFTYAFGQTEANGDLPTDQSSDSVFVTVEQIPEFPGGLPGLADFLGANLRYPREARRANVTGRVFAAFVVGSDGMIRDVQISKGIGYGCDEEVVRVVKLMPRWKPGIQDGRAVPVRFSLPINFTLTGRGRK